MDFGFFKRHPILTGALAIVLIVVFFMFSGWLGKGGGTIVTTGTSPDQTAANLQLQIAQMGLQARAQDNAMALEATRIQSQTAIETASLAADLEALRVAAQQALGLAGVDATNKQTAAQLEAIRISTEQNIALAGIAKQQANHQADLQWDLMQKQIAADREAQGLQFWLQNQRDQISGQIQGNQMWINAEQNNKLIGMLQQQLTGT